MSHKCLNRRRLIWFFPLLVFLLIISGCEGIKEKMQHMQSNGEAQTAPQEEQENSITLTSEIVELEDGFSAVRYDGDYGFDDFLASGGASSDGEVVEYLANNLLSGLNLWEESSVAAPLRCRVRKETPCLAAILTGRTAKLWLWNPIQKTAMLLFLLSIWILSPRMWAAAWWVWL